MEEGSTPGRQGKNKDLSSGTGARTRALHGGTAFPGRGGWKDHSLVRGEADAQADTRVRGTALAPAPTTPRGAGPAAGPPGPRWGGQAMVS